MHEVLALGIRFGGFSWIHPWCPASRWVGGSAGVPRLLVSTFRVFEKQNRRKNYEAKRFLLQRLCMFVNYLEAVFLFIKHLGVVSVKLRTIIKPKKLTPTIFPKQTKFILTFNYCIAYNSCFFHESDRTDVFYIVQPDIFLIHILTAYFLFIFIYLFIFINFYLYSFTNIYMY